MEKILLLKYKKLFSIIITFLTLTAFLLTVIVLADNPENTLVYVNPASQIIARGKNFNISINCDPGQPIKSFEFKLSFNASLINANSVSEGNIFNGYNTYFSSGIINNTSGTIINVYGLILGQGNVTNPGSLANISFTAKNISGISFLNIYDLGITNETSYVLTNLTNGTVQIDGTAPVFVDLSPSQGYTGDNFTFSVNVTDNVDSGGNLSVWVNWSHGSSYGNNSMSRVGGNIFEKTITLNLNSVLNLTYFFYANDSYGNGNKSVTKNVSVSDNDLPSISNITANPGVQEVGGYVNISAKVTDNINVSSVYLNVTYPNSSFQNFSITSNVSSNIYYCNKTYNQYGTHYYLIWAKDQYNNIVTSSSYSFLIGDYTGPIISNISRTTSNPLDTDPSFGWVNITCKVVDNVGVKAVYLNITNPNGTFNNISMNPSGSNNYYSNSSSAFSQYGNYTYFIWSTDNDSNFANSASYNFSLPPNYDVNMDGAQNVLDLVMVSNVYWNSGNNGWIRQDVDNNGIIQILDMVLISNHYGESWW